MAGCRGLYGLASLFCLRLVGEGRCRHRWRQHQSVARRAVGADTPVGYRLPGEESRLRDQGQASDLLFGLRQDRRSGAGDY